MSNVTHAKVKFDDDKSVKIVPIDKIVEFRDAKPVDVNGFDKNALYRCLWSDKKNPEEVELLVQISDLAVIENEEDLQSFENKRGRFLKINETIINEFYKNLENDNDNSKKLTSKKSSLDKNALSEKKRVQKEILNEKMSKFINSNSLLKLSSDVETAFQENFSQDVLVNNVEEKQQYDYSALQERFNELLENHNNLKSKYSSLEKENVTLRFLNQNLQMKLLNPSEKCSDMQVEQPVSSNKSQSKKTKIDLEISAAKIVQDKECTQIDDWLHTSSPILSQGQCTSSKEISKSELNDLNWKTDLDDSISKTDLNDSIDNEMAQGYQSPCTTPTRKRLYSPSNSDAETPVNHIAKKLLFDNHESQKHNNQEIHKDNRKEKKLHKTEKKKIENDSKKRKFEKEVNKSKENKADNSLDKNNEKKKKKSKERDENNENGQTGEPEFLSKCQFEEDGTKVYKMYLGEGIYMEQDSWNEILHVSTSNRFTVALLKEFYTPQQLSQRSLSGSETWKTPNGVHTRQKLTPKKYRVIQKCTKYYLKKKFKMSQSQLDKEMSLSNKHITGYISKVVNSMKPNKQTKNKEFVDESVAKEKSDTTIESG